MLGWEFPPAFSGGLGIVTKNLVEALLRQGQDVTLILPQFIARKAMQSPKNAFLKKAFDVSVKKIEAFLAKRLITIPTTLASPYVTQTQYEDYQRVWSETEKIRPQKGLFVEPQAADKSIYGENLFLEIERFVAEVLASVEDDMYDVVHAHDWITAEAAIQLKLQRNLPYILHIHATEVDRVGQDSPDSEVFRREKYAMELADKVVTVSHYTKGILMNVYKIPAEKISVVHNAHITRQLDFEASDRWKKDKSQFWVLFIGRVTLQKGPDYFVETARKVMARQKNVHFLIVGDGDMMPKIIETVAREKLHDNVHCLGFLSPEDRDALYLFTDACIIPSVSEPFGLTATEGVFHKSPLILSKTCGANELIHHKLSVDFWDTDQMAEYVLALEKYPYLRRVLRTKAISDFPAMDWDTQAQRVMEIYNTF